MCILCTIITISCSLRLKGRIHLASIWACFIQRVTYYHKPVLLLTDTFTTPCFLNIFFSRCYSTNLFVSHPLGFKVSFTHCSELVLFSCTWLHLIVLQLYISPKVKYFPIIIWQKWTKYWTKVIICGNSVHTKVTFKGITNQSIVIQLAWVKVSDMNTLVDSL